MSTALSIAAAAAEAPEQIGLIALDTPAGDRASTFAELAELARLAGRALPAPSPGSGGSAMILIAERTLDTVVTLYAALDASIPVALVHARASAAERARLTALASQPAARAAGLAAILFTSGSSAAPKGVLLGRDAFEASALASAARLGWHPDDRWLCCLPLAHVGGLSIVTRCLTARRTVVLARESRFDPASIIAAIERHRVTLLSLVPTMLVQLLDAGWSPPGHLRAVLLGGALARPGLLERAAGAGVPVLVTYGMTETCSQICTQVPGEHRHAGQIPGPGGQVGPPLPGIQVRVHDGRIQVRGPVLFRGYVGEAAAAPESESESESDAGWFDTGDTGWLDEHGHLHVVGRIDDTIITGGENVHPAEVEAVLERHPAIQAACVFGLPDTTWDQIIACAVVPGDAPPALHDLASFLAKALPGHKRPRRIAFMTELALGPTGKPDRKAIARQARAALVGLDYRPRY